MRADQLPGNLQKETFAEKLEVSFCYGQKSLLENGKVSSKKTSSWWLSPKERLIFLKSNPSQILVLKCGHFCYSSAADDSSLQEPRKLMPPPTFKIKDNGYNVEWNFNSSSLPVTMEGYYANLEQIAKKHQEIDQLWGASKFEEGSLANNFLIHFYSNF